MIQAKLGHPATGSPNNNALTNTKTTIIAAIKQKNKPSIDATTKGSVENAKSPSKEYKNNFQKLHFVSPATLSTFSYSNHFV